MSFVKERIITVWIDSRYHRITILLNMAWMILEKPFLSVAPLLGRPGIKSPAFGEMGFFATNIDILINSMAACC
ncbi:hypothetical protein TNCV_1855341 [Trichonephila clavipes]|nr:hypothetical protein TNCV_1855341 [Trichonephila clavipes]